MVTQNYYYSLLSAPKLKLILHIEMAGQNWLNFTKYCNTPTLLHDETYSISSFLFYSKDIKLLESNRSIQIVSRSLLNRWYDGDFSRIWLTNQDEAESLFSQSGCNTTTSSSTTHNSHFSILVHFKLLQTSYKQAVLFFAKQVARMKTKFVRFIWDNKVLFSRNNIILCPCVKTNLSVSSLIVLPHDFS